MMQMLTGCLASALLVTLATGCPTPQPLPPEPGPLEPGHLATPESPNGAEENGLEPDPEMGDYWLRRYESFFAEEQRARYLATAPEARYDEYGHLLLDLQARAELLDAAKHLLNREEVALYYQLPDYRACITFVRARASRRQRGPGQVENPNAESAKTPPQESQRSP